MNAKHWGRMLGAALLLAGLTHCDSDGGTAEPGIPLGTYVTYNAGLAYGFVPYAEARLPLVGPAVAKLGADVVCLQEVWEPADVSAVIAATAEALPHAYWDDTTGTGGTLPAACGEAEAAPMRVCVDTNCDGVPVDGLADCVLTECGTEFSELSDDCAGCLAANIGGTADEIFAACAEEGSPRYAYDAANGLLLLSRWELVDRTALVLDSTTNLRAALFARARDERGDTIALVCTHLTTVFGFTYRGEHDSWAGEQAHQIGQILDLLGERTVPGEPVVFLGDTNNGPAVGTSVTAELPENYALLTTAGFVEPYVARDDATCTHCPDSPLNPEGGDSAIIDHAMIRDLPEGAAATATRILTELVTMDTGADGVQDLPLSDHYGVALTLQ